MHYPIYQSLIKLRQQRSWIHRTDDDRADCLIIVTSAQGFTFTDTPERGVKAFDCVADVRRGFSRSCILPGKARKPHAPSTTVQASW